MNRLLTRLLSLIVAMLLFAVPMGALATSSLDMNNEDPTEGITDNPDLTDAEKEQWLQWASEEPGEGSAATGEEAKLIANLEAAMDDSDQMSEEDQNNLEINTALPDDVINILLLGVDNRSVDLKSGLSDAVIICSINTTEGTVKLTSITRDTEVQVPGYKSNKRINVAFKYGSKDGDITHGGYLAMKTVNRNFQMNIQRYVVVNIHGLASIIDALGGIDLDMTSKEASRINFELRKEPMDKVKREKVQAIEGVQHLDGMQAVTFARIRGIDSDFMRSERQRKLLETLMSQVMKDIDIGKLIKLIETALPYGATNLTAGDLVSIGGMVIGGTAMTDMLAGNHVLEQFRIPMDETWKYKDVSGATLTSFRSDKARQENIEEMQKFIYGQSYYQD